MKAQIKSDFEKWLITQMSSDTIGRYLTISSKKVYLFFEGEDNKNPPNSYINIGVTPNDTERIATNTLYHSGYFRFYIYDKSPNPIFADKISDYLATLMQEKDIDVSGSFRIQMGLLSVKQRGNKFAGMDYYENICNLDFEHWACV